MVFRPPPKKLKMAAILKNEFFGKSTPAEKLRLLVLFNIYENQKKLMVA